MIRAENIRVIFGDSVALDSVSLTVEDGEMMVLLGPSGCGKTTFLRAMAGLIVPERGRIFFGEKDVTEMPAHLRNVGMVFQNYALFPNMNVRENISFGLEMRKKDGRYIKKRVKEMLSLTGLEGCEERSIDELSGGEQQRVALARAIAPEPEILLLDEPLSALDAKLRKSLRAEIKRIQSELGITAVYVTHDQEEAMAMAHRIAVMNSGRIEQIGTPEEIYRNPKNLFVADFIGESNIFEGIAEHGKIRTPLGDFEAGGIKGRAYVVLRPEDIFLSEKGIEAHVNGVEILGAELKIDLDINGRSVILRENAGKIGNAAELYGKRVFVEVNRRSARIFKK